MHPPATNVDLQGVSNDSLSETPPLNLEDRPTVLEEGGLITSQQKATLDVDDTAQTNQHGLADTSSSKAIPPSGDQQGHQISILVDTAASLEGAAGSVQDSNVGGSCDALAPPTGKNSRKA
ncbi:hypothetical protein HK102_007450, partial [Quaeritorhiza haematococci]